MRSKLFMKKTENLFIYENLFKDIVFLIEFVVVRKKMCSHEIDVTSGRRRSAKDVMWRP